MAAILAMLVFATSHDAVAEPPSDAVTPEVQQAVLQADADVFAIVFGNCQWTQLKSLVARDMEFYHDRHGRMATSGDQFIGLIRKKCAREASGEDYRARRELDRDSVQLHAIGDFGVLEIGTHRFFRLHEDGSESLVEQAAFAQIWRRDGKRWKLARVISYGHEKLAEQP
ncbi:DUF4440 domain-containing protein [Ahniella affigens]|nr:DUF4440 domain-containing protein [Ahniella affigens]